MKLLSVDMDEEIYDGGEMFFWMRACLKRLLSIVYSGLSFLVILNEVKNPFLGIWL